MSFASVAIKPPKPWLHQLPGVIGDYSLDLLLIIISYGVAGYFRRTLPFGKFVGDGYEWSSGRLYLVIALSLLAAYVPLLTPEPDPKLRAIRRFWTALAGIGLVCLGLTLFLPEQSGLQKGYFAAFALLLSMLVIPRSVGTAGDGTLTSSQSLRRLWANRTLLRIWVGYNVRSRYAQAALGMLWIVLLPLSTALVMTIVFSEIMRISLPDVPFIVFFLSGLVVWQFFSQAISGGMRSILGTMGLINQIYFPREIIVLSALGEALVDALFTFAAMLVVNAVAGVWPNPRYVVLPLLLLLLLVFSLGLMLMVSWLSVLVRDVPQLVSVALQIGFYLCPILYPVTVIPERFRFLITLNPVAAIIEAFHRVIVYNSWPVWTSLLYPAALGTGLLIFGYRLFKTNEDRMADMV